jgi:hypothetical protein
MFILIYLSISELVAQTSDDLSEQIMEIRSESNPSQEFTNYGMNAKVNLNKANKKELAQLQFLTEEEIEIILDHRDSFGNYLDILELQQLFLSIDKIRMLAEHVIVKTSSSVWIKQGRHWEVSLSHSINSLTPRIDSIQNPGKWVFRQRYNSSTGLVANLILEKDYGEKFLPNGLGRGVDYTSVSFEIPVNNKITCYIGDYSANLGEGLIVGQGYRKNKSSLVIDVANKKSGLRSYRSVDENRFFRGLALKRITDNTSTNIFVSRLKRDAIVDNDGIVSLVYSGLHRSETELKQKDAALFYELGGGFSAFSTNGELGMNIVSGLIQPKLINQSNIYSQFKPTGSEYFKASLHHVGHWGNVRIFGEWAMSTPRALGLVEGIQLSLSKSLDLSGLIRYYDKRYDSYQSQGFGERGNPANESGFYIGFRYRREKWKIAGNIDVFAFPYPNKGKLTATNGSDYLLNFTRNISKSIYWYLRYSGQMKEDFKRVGDSLFLGARKSHKFRWHLENKISTQWRIRCRIELNTFRWNRDKLKLGRMVYSDVRFKPSSILTFTYRIMIATTDGFDNRIYVYENDIPNSFSMPFFYRNTLRNYVLCRWKVGLNTDFYVRFATDKVYGNLSLQQGVLYIANHSKSEIKFHIQQRF